MMTRNEAEEIINRYGYDVNSDRHFTHVNQIVTVFEKLGLIKFDEEKQIKSPSLVIRDVYPGMGITGSDKIINALMAAGYIIARKGD